MKIYVLALDSENFIEHTVTQLLRTFEPNQIEVVDLGSQDSTRERIPSVVKTSLITLPNDETRGSFYTKLKSELSARQEWSWLVDADEVLNLYTMNRIVDWYDNRALHGETYLRMYCRPVDFQDNHYLSSREFLSMGAKLFSSKHWTFAKSWPKELLVSRSDAQLKSKGEFTACWFHHMVLLPQSDSVREATVRRKKRLWKLSAYRRFLTWEQIPAPWTYDPKPESEFTVVNMSVRDGLDTRWSGKWPV